MTVMSRPQTTPETLAQETIDSFRSRGFVHIPGIITPEEAGEFREAALSVSERLTALSDSGMFRQLVNVWQQDDAMRRLTLHPNVGAVAERLVGGPLRLWHDQILIKPANNSKPTEFHQDQPYWPHAKSPNPISAWIALCDVPVERGCMTFIPGSHKRTDLPAQNLADKRSLFQICPEMEWEERVTLPLRAGDCTFHHGRCAHMATPNLTNDPRVAHVVIFMDADAQFTGAGHVVTDPLGLTPSESFEHPMFPRVAG